MRNVAVLIGLFFQLGAFSKTTDDKEVAYTRMLFQRVEKIVSPLSIADTVKAASVIDLIIRQYRDLNDICTERVKNIGMDIELIKGKADLE